MIDTPDGAQGWRAVRQYRPDAVVTDADMPEITGLQLCRAIREDADLSPTPVLLVSGSTEPDDASAREAGVTSIVAKPVLGSTLVRRIQEILAHPSHQHG